MEQIWTKTATNSSGFIKSVCFSGGGRSRGRRHFLLCRLEHMVSPHGSKWLLKHQASPTPSRQEEEREGGPLRPSQGWPPATPRCREPGKSGCPPEDEGRQVPGGTQQPAPARGPRRCVSAREPDSARASGLEQLELRLHIPTELLDSPSRPRLRMLCVHIFMVLGR